MNRETGIQPVNKRQKRSIEYIKATKENYKKKLQKKLLDYLCKSALKVRGQKAYCDGHTDKLVYTISCGFWQ